MKMEDSKCNELQTQNHKPLVWKRGGAGGAGGGETVIDISHLPAGMYFLKTGNKVVKVVKR